MFIKKSFYDIGKKAQVGKTVTWIVATIAIIIILLASIFITTLGPQGSKEIGSRNIVDPLASKSLFSYLLTENDEGVNVYEQMKEEENLNNFSGELALDVFDDFYSEEYERVWFGVAPTRIIIDPSNDYFGFRPSAVEGFGLRRGFFGVGVIQVITEEVYLDEENIVELILDKIE
ncbi:MAG: hypothetical protein WDZ69_03060 [Candidatus Pacearchaeota archaeon]